MSIIQTAHGIHLPPRKKKDRSRSLTLRFVLTGTIPSKKNRQVATMPWRRLIKAIRTLISTAAGSGITIGQIVALFKQNKPYIRQSDEFRAWHEEAKQKIVEQAQKQVAALNPSHDLVLPASRASISIYHYWKDDRVRDNSNKAETIHDLLVDAAILTGDTWQELSPIKADADLYRGEILDHITVIDLTLYEW